jgi:hypothetical protein
MSNEDESSHPKVRRLTGKNLPRRGAPKNLYTGHGTAAQKTSILMIGFLYPSLLSDASQKRGQV